MKKNLIWLAITAAYMLLIPYLLVTFAGESAMAFAFMLFYGLNPLFCLVAGIFAGLDQRHNWVIALMPPLLFLGSVWLCFDIYERIFYEFAAVYLLICLVCMLFVGRESSKQIKW
jgi:hypothetical protein